MVKQAKSAEKDAEKASDARKHSRLLEQNKELCAKLVTENIENFKTAPEFKLKNQFKILKTQIESKSIVTKKAL